MAHLLGDSQLLTRRTQLVDGRTLGAQGLPQAEQQLLALDLQALQRSLVSGFTFAVTGVAVVEQVEWCTQADTGHQAIARLVRTAAVFIALRQAEAGIHPGIPGRLAIAFGMAQLILALAQARMSLQRLLPGCQRTHLRRQWLSHSLLLRGDGLPGQAGECRARPVEQLRRALAAALQALPLGLLQARLGSQQPAFVLAPL